ncbi:hypothetical protein ACNQ17_00735 [Mycoplasma sp. Sp48II]|uniref:hypothetical protein n=1 Tax=Mycoplasma sp. Sp48II TaxID=3401682 RepID=UPI003AAAB07D
MNIKAFNRNLVLTINGDSNWAFNDDIKFSYHAFNYSKVNINNVIHRSQFKSKHLEYLNVLDKIPLHSIATLSSNGLTFFTGIITSIGRLSLHPNKVKDFSIEISDIREWLSKKTPADIQFINLSPTRALNAFIEALDEPKIKIGKVNFTNNDNINAYDTVNKNAYSILKEIIATQTKSFLYFTTDKNGNLLINFKSEQEFKAQEALTVSPQNWKDLKITDITLDTNSDHYINKIRFESENIISSKPVRETQILNKNLDSVVLKNNIAYWDDDQEFNFYIDTTSEDKKQIPLVVIPKSKASEGFNYHFYYTAGENEIIRHPEFTPENKVVTLSYFIKRKSAVTVENSKEIKRINELTNFRGDVYAYDKYNDFSNIDDLYKFAQHELDLKSKLVNNLNLTCEVPFLNIGDSINLNSGINGVDGKYICNSFSGTYQGSSDTLKINYYLASSLDADTILNYYDSQAFRDNPARKKEKLQSKYQDIKYFTNFLHWKVNIKIRQNGSYFIKNVGLPQYLPYGALYARNVKIENTRNRILLDKSDPITANK